MASGYGVPASAGTDVLLERDSRIGARTFQGDIPEPDRLKPGLRTPERCLREPRRSACDASGGLGPGREISPPRKSLPPAGLFFGFPRRSGSSPDACGIAGTSEADTWSESAAARICRINGWKEGIPR